MTHDDGLLSGVLYSLLLSLLLPHLDHYIDSGAVTCWLSGVYCINSDKLHCQIERQQDALPTLSSQVSIVGYVHLMLAPVSIIQGKTTDNQIAFSFPQMSNKTGIILLNKRDELEEFCNVLYNCTCPVTHCLSSCQPPISLQNTEPRSKLHRLWATLSRLL